MSKTLVLSQPYAIARVFNFSGKSFIKFFFFSLIFLLFSLSIVSVWQINAYSRDIFLLQSYGQKLNAMSKENKTLEINFNKSNSLKNFADYIENQPFEKAVKIDYIQDLGGKVVSKAK